MDTDLKIILTSTKEGDNKVFQKTYRQQGDDPTSIYEFPEIQKQTAKFRLEIRNLNDGIISNIHIREVN